MFSCEFQEISEKNFFHRTSPVGASEGDDFKQTYL